MSRQVLSREGGLHWTTEPPSYPCETPIPASERPTERAIPRAPRLPADLAPPRAVEEIRYDLEHGSAGAELWGPKRVRDLMLALDPAEAYQTSEYVGLTSAEAEALSHARCALINAAKRLGARFQ